MTTLVDAAMTTAEIISNCQPKSGEWIAYCPGSETPYCHAYRKEYPSFIAPGNREKQVIVSQQPHWIFVWSSASCRSDVIAAMGEEYRFCVRWADEDDIPAMDIQWPSSAEF